LAAGLERCAANFAAAKGKKVLILKKMSSAENVKLRLHPYKPFSIRGSIHAAKNAKQYGIYMPLHYDKISAGKKMERPGRFQNRRALGEKIFEENGMNFTKRKPGLSLRIT